MNEQRTIEILLVEDNPNDVALAEYAFRKLNIASHIKVLRDGAEALAFFFGPEADTRQALYGTPVVILLDLKLPLVSGLEVLRQIKAHPRTRTIPVVMLTSSREERDIIESYQLGVNSYIVKPVDFAQFTDAMQTMGMYWLLHNQQPSL